jgi:TniQ
VRPLRLTVPLGVGETPASFVSRLAARYAPSAREFCLDFGTTFQKVVDGDPEALAMVAAKGGVAPEALAANAFVKTGERRYLLRGEALVRGSLRRATVAICPKCLAGDIADAAGLRAELAPYQRARWQIAAVKMCPIHATPLAVLEKDLTPNLLHDWSHHVAKVLPQLARLVTDAATRPLTGLETYVAMRVVHGPVGGRLPDTFALHVAIAACELFGAVAAFGRRVNLKRLTDEEWRHAGGAGFDIFAGGSAGVAAFLEDLRSRYPYSGAATEGPQAVFGRIYQVLQFGREDQAFDPLRDLVGNFIRTRFPVGPGNVVFGKPVERRVLHSIRTLSIETKLHPKRLRKLLEASGTLPEGSGDLADGNCLFDAQRGSSVAQEAAVASLSVRKAGEYLNAPRVQRDMLYRTGLIVPRVRGVDHGAADQFAPEDLDAFLDRLLDGAEPVEAAGAGQVNIPDAAKQCCCGSEEVVRLIFEGKLARKWRLTAERGYMSVLVDVKEVRAMVRGPDKGDFTGLDLKDKLSTTAKVAAALIKHGHLKTITVVNPINRCPTVVVPVEEVERFGKQYVSLFALAKQRGRHFLKVKQELDAAGIKPALDPEKVGATFYRRADLHQPSRQL